MNTARINIVYMPGATHSNGNWSIINVENNTLSNIRKHDKKIQFVMKRKNILTDASIKS